MSWDNGRTFFDPTLESEKREARLKERIAALEAQLAKVTEERDEAQARLRAAEGALRWALERLPDHNHPVTCGVLGKPLCPAHAALSEERARVEGNRGKGRP